MFAFNTNHVERYALKRMHLGLNLPEN